MSHDSLPEPRRPASGDIARTGESEIPESRSNSPGTSSLGNAFVSATVVVAVFLLLAYTASFYPWTWDEGDMDFRANLSTFWIQRVLYRIPGVRNMVPMTPELEEVGDFDTLGDLFSEWGLSSFWTGTTWLEGHPQLPVILVIAGRQIAPSFLPDQVLLRFGPMLFFAFAIGSVFYRLRSDFDRTTAWFSVAAILSIPRLFAHAHIAAWDSTLAASWMLCWAVFPFALKSSNGAVVFGACMGMAFASKFPGFGVVIPVFVWLLLRLAFDRTFFAGERIRLFKLAAIAALAAVVVFFFLTPPIWHKPVGGIVAYFSQNMNRDINVATLFLGKMYDLYHSLPWYNVFFWTAITVPVGLIVLSGFGIYTIIRKRSICWSGLLIFLNLLTLLVVRSFPGTPVHDGVRLFVSSFPFLGMLAGIGAASLWKGSFRRFSAAPSFLPVGMLRRTLGRSFVVGVFSTCLFNMFWYAPQWLSFYNILIGGLPGAVRAGMEPTYYWDGFDNEVIDWINKHTGPDERIAFSSGNPETFSLYYKEKRIKPNFVGGPEVPVEVFAQPLSEPIYTTRYYILQRRPSAEFDWDRYFIKNRKPVFVKTIRKGGWGPWDLSSVPIIEIYDVSDLPQWQRTEEEEDEE